MRTFLIALCVIGLSSPWVIYRRNHKKKLVCKEDPTNSTSSDESSEETTLSSARSRRDIEVDPISRQPIIYLGRKNKTSKVYDDDFDLVSDQLTDEEIEEVKNQIRETCAALRLT
ncbi:hypothetical protein V3C99_009172 [Haemonchus contortus]